MIKEPKILEPVLLSIVVTSHEQPEQLRRCIDSILAMRIDYPYEIIISDDRSNDGTYELALQYAKDADDGIYNSNGLVRIVATQCNSDDCNPGNNSDRCGFNKCNGFKLTSGKYFTFVDADDYFREGSDVYCKQIYALEQHPQCVLSMSNYVYINDGEDITEDSRIQLPRVLKDGDIITSDDFIENFLFHLNQAFMMRKDSTIDPVKLYGKEFNDTVVTYHYLQYGSIVFVDACDYVYIQYNNSITGSMTQTNQDRKIMWCLPLCISALIPKWRNTFIRIGYGAIREVLDMAKSNYMLQKKNYISVQCFHMWIYECFGHYLTFNDKIRIKVCRYWQYVQKKRGWYGNVGCWIMWKLLK